MSAEILSAPLESIVDQSVEEGVELDKCVVGQYRTTLEQKTAFQNHIKDFPRTDIPVEWVIDIADESNGWFYGTAYHFDDTTQMLHVMVPDKHNPSFDGKVILDHRTVHLIECVDGKTEALFSKIVRDSVVKVKWEVEWFEEDNQDGAPAASQPEEGVNGKWVISSARYYIRMANQLLVEDENFGEASRGFVMLTADLNVKLRMCHKGRGQEDFNRLVNEGITQSTPEALAAAKLDVGTPASKTRLNGGQADSASKDPIALPSTRKLADMAKGLRECISEILDEREKTSASKARLAAAFTSFTLDGDLDAGLMIMDEFENDKVKSKEQEQIDSTADEAWYLAQKMEKSLGKILKSGADLPAAGAPAPAGGEDPEALKKMLKRMRKEMEEKEREIEALRAASVSRP